MFYQTEDNMEDYFRFGDVIEGFIGTYPDIINPYIINKSNDNYKVHIDRSKYFVIMTPCCNIGDGLISITPLIKIEKTLVDIPYFYEDYTRVNKIISDHVKAMKIEKWNALNDEQKENLKSEPPSYRFKKYFVYDKHKYYDTYTYHNREREEISISHYMIDFRLINKVKCDKIKKNNDKNIGPIDSKRLQLTDETRDDLKKKIAYYFYGDNNQSY